MARVGQGDAPFTLAPFADTGDFRERWGEVDFLARAAQRTGGERHSSVFGDPTARAFAGILDDFRVSYVLRYSPRGVASAGWHTVTVGVPNTRGATVRARSGYFSGRGKGP